MRAGIQHRDRERIPEAGQGGSWRYLRMCSQQYAARLLEMLDETHVRHAEVASRSPPRRRGCQDRFPGDSACLPKCVVMMHIRMAHNAHMNLHWSDRVLQLNTTRLAAWQRIGWRNALRNTIKYFTYMYWCICSSDGPRSTRTP